MKIEYYIRQSSNKYQFFVIESLEHKICKVFYGFDDAQKYIESINNVCTKIKS